MIRSKERSNVRSTEKHTIKAEDMKRQKKQTSSCNSIEDSKMNNQHKENKEGKKRVTLVKHKKIM